MSKLPDKNSILEWIRDNPHHASKRDVAKAFGIRGSARIELKRLLKELEAEGALAKSGKRFRDPDGLPPVSVLRIAGPDAHGDLLAEPAQWDSDDPVPQILFQLRPGEPALGEGDRVLGRLTPTPDADHPFSARLIRRIGTGPRSMIGIFRQSDKGGRIVPIDKKSDREWVVEAAHRMGARDGELVEAEQTAPRGQMGLPKARITERLGDPSAPKAVSLIAIHEHGIPDSFPDDVIEEAEAAQPLPLGQRTDLRHLPLITIDPADARDHDDAIYAIPEKDGFTLWVAIADVAAYVRPGTALDREARQRGNSTYFPDRVVPMLPDTLSGDLCSLHEGVDRPCIAVEIKIDHDGQKQSHRFLRGLMRCPAALSYEQAQAADDGNPDDKAAALQQVISPLFAAYRTLSKAREKRQPLNLDLPERKIVLSDEGKVVSVAFRDRFDAHKLVEEFMVLANVCAAETLEQKKQPLLYRVHEEPSPEKLDALRATAQEAGLSLPKGQVLQTRHLNQLLDAAAGGETAELINLSVLRSMTQAYYGPQNFSHFGLNLKRYAHFTSPIRRYADLIVHRALISAHGWGTDGLTLDEVEHLPRTAEQISTTERRSMMAERDTTDRYLAAYLADRTGAEFTGRISGVARFGLFVKLDETGADGLIPVSTLGDEYFVHDPDNQTLMGDRSGRRIGLGQPVLVRLSEAEAITGGLVFELLEVEGKAMPQTTRRSKGTPRRKQTRARTKARKISRKRNRSK
ncbi:ribonuclease R [Halovulum sp. GXIMD14793]